MKKKILLGAAAGALVLALAIGGTLMLFTATTETATNVVTLSPGIRASLWEKGGNLVRAVDNGSVSYGVPSAATDDYVEDFLEVGGTYDETTQKPANSKDGKWEGNVFKGIDFKTLTPNAQIHKEPIIRRSDVAGAAAYVRVKGEVKVTAANGDTVTLTDAQKAFVLSILATGRLGDDWRLVADAGNLSGYYYYVGSDSKLKPLLAPTAADSPTSTMAIFTELKIPNLSGANLEVWTGKPAKDSNSEIPSMVGWKISVELTAELVQVDNNPYYADGTDGTGWALAFNVADFPAT